ncbi:MAG TPA: DUF916 domain-containing protein [Candidatus Pacebacteria bacterium]|nr:DUF916 domain-containing protein [Candidatus Paceibacterota bacterium]
MEKITICSVGVFLMLFVICFGSEVQAGLTPEEGVQVSPIRFDWQLKSGEQKTEEIVVHNFSDISHDIEVQVEDFFVSNDSQQANFFVPDENHPLKAYDVIDWIDAPENFTLAPGETKRLTFTVNVPEDQPTSGYYGSIFFKTNTNEGVVEDGASDGMKLDVNYRVGVLVTFAVQGAQEMRIDGDVEDFGVTKKVFWKSPITVFAKLRSSGNVHYKAGGKMEIRKFGKRFAVVKVEDEIMYPDKERTFKERVIFGMWDYGVYSATLDMQSEDGSITFKDNGVVFFVIPWKTTATIVSVIALVIIIWKIFNKKFAIIKRGRVK